MRMEARGQAAATPGCLVREMRIRPVLDARRCLPARTHMVATADALDESEFLEQAPQLVEADVGVRVTAQNLLEELVSPAHCLLSDGTPVLVPIHHATPQ